jgi:hypothetical protein
VSHKQPTEQSTPSSEPQPSVSQYSRICKPTKWMQESLEQRNIACQAYYKAMHEDDYTHFKMKWWIQLPSYHMPSRIPCTSMKQCKHQTHTNSSRL